MLVNLNQVLLPAKQGKYAVGLFNTTDTDMLEAVISAAEELNSPVIIGTAEILLPYGELKLIAPALIAAAKRAKVPVVVHYDHGLTFERCMEALKLGFSSLMFDGSTKSYEDNIAETQEIVKIAKEFGASVEGEIGHVGSNDNEADGSMYTTKEEAEAYIKATGVDALAIAIGTAHGVYKQKPKLNLERLEEIRATVDTPLVIHGGSGLSDDDFRNTIANGIRKINICTEMCVAAREAYIASANHEILFADAKNAVKNVVKGKMQLFGSSNKA